MLSEVSVMTIEELYIAFVRIQRGDPEWVEDTPPVLDWYDLN